MCSNWKITFLLGTVIISLGIVFNGLLAYSSAQNTVGLIPKDINDTTDGTYAVNIKNTPLWGNKEAPITIVEFSDFDCPFCKKAYDDILPTLKRDYIDTGKLRFYYKNAPLDMHENAKVKAAAALCAKDQKGDDAYYAYHNQLYTVDNDQLDIKEVLLSIAKKNTLNIELFEKCLNTNQNVHDQIDLDKAEAAQIGASGTPTWFIGKTNQKGDIIKGIRIEGTQPYSVYRILINQLLKE